MSSPHRVAGSCLGRLPLGALAAAVALLGPAAAVPRHATAQAPQVAPPTTAVDWRSETAPSILLAVSRPPAGRRAAAAPTEAQLALLYGPDHGRAIRIDGAGALTGDAREALALLAAAEDDGLMPSDYDADVLAARAAAIGAGPPEREALARFDVSLSRGVLRVPARAAPGPRRSEDAGRGPEPGA